MGSAGNAKGSAYERKICRELSLWWTKGKRDDIFYRTAGSGGRATKRAKQNLTTANSAGDVGILDPIGKPFLDKVMIEIKRGYTKGNEAKQIRTLSIIDNPKNQKEPLLIKWWNKALKEAYLDNNKEVMIIFKRDRKNACAMLSFNMMNMIKYYNNIFYEKHLLIMTKPKPFCIILLDDFFKWCKPNTFKQKYEIKLVRRQIKRRKLKKWNKFIP